MSDAIVVALITGGISLIGIIASAWSNRRATDAKLDKNLAVLETKFDSLTNEVKRHNNFAERIPSLEQKVSDIDERLKYREGLG